MCEYSSPCCGCCVWLPFTLLCVWVRLLCCGCCVTTTYLTVGAVCVWVLLTLLWMPCVYHSFCCDAVYEYCSPCCMQARERDATGGEKRLGMEMAQTLKTIIDPYFLRRTKAQVKEEEKDAGTKGRPHPKSIKWVNPPSPPTHPHRRPIPSLSSGRPPTPTPQNKLGAPHPPPQVHQLGEPPTHTHTNTHTGRPHHKFRWVNPPPHWGPTPSPSSGWPPPPHAHTQGAPPPSPSSGWPPSPAQGGPSKSMKWVNAPTPHREPPPPCQWVNPPPPPTGGPPSPSPSSGWPHTHTHTQREAPPQVH